MSPKLLHRGSVKDIYELSGEELLFRFSDRYSIFDWGVMPDPIPLKGEALAKMGDKLLRFLKNEGVSTHYLGWGEKGTDLKVRAVQVPRGDIQIYQDRPKLILIPLEVIYRFGVPKGSSLLRKLKTENDWIQAGFDRRYQEGEWFTEPKLGFTTKLEQMDRSLSPEEAKTLSGMNEEEWKSLNDLTRFISSKLKTVFESSGLKLWDGKLEFAFDANRNIMLVDSIGLDEIRLTFQNQTLSKELLRQAYLDTSWYQALNLAKEKAPVGFKEYCINILKESPQKLSASTIQAMSRLYQITADLILCTDQAEVKMLQQELSQSLKTLSEAK